MSAILCKWRTASFFPWGRGTASSESLLSSHRHTLVGFHASIFFFVAFVFVPSHSESHCTWNRTLVEVLDGEQLKVAGRVCVTFRLDARTVFDGCAPLVSCRRSVVRFRIRRVLTRSTLKWRVESPIPSSLAGSSSSGSIRNGRLPSLPPSSAHETRCAPAAFRASDVPPSRPRRTPIAILSSESAVRVRNASKTT